MKLTALSMAARFGAAALVAGGLACGGEGDTGGDDGSGLGPPTVDFEPRLTLDAFIGGSPFVTGKVTNCIGSPELVVYADDLDILHLSFVTIFTVEFIGDPEPIEIFQVSIPEESLPIARFGLPALADIELEVQCGNRRVRSPPLEIAYIPTQASVVPDFNPRRFWADIVVGDVITCEGSVIKWFAGAVAEVDAFDLGFSCGAGNLVGAPEDRRYMESEGSGIAAIDPAGFVVWAERYNLRSSTTDSQRDPVIIYEQGIDDWLAVLDRETGDQVVGPIELTEVALGSPYRTAGGDILVLQGIRDEDNTMLTYTVRRFDELGADLGEVEIAHYDFNAPSYLAIYDFFGDFMYVTRATDEETRWLAKIDLNDCPAGVCNAVWETTTDDAYFIPLTESGDERLLAASDDGFIWLNRDNGTPQTDFFGPDSGNRFLRADIEDDGSLVMLADAVGPAAQGLYIFDSQGNTILRYTSPNALFRWLTTGWGDGAMVSYYDELHVLHSRRGYVDMLQE